MKNTGSKLMCKYTLLGFISGGASLLPQFFILSGFVTNLGLGRLLTNSYTLSILCFTPFLFTLAGFLFALSRISQLKLGALLLNTENEKQALQHDLSEYKYALNQCAVVTTIDCNGKIKSVNENFLEFTGYACKDIIGRSAWRLPSSLQKPGVFDSIKRNIDEGKVWKGEIEYYKANGNIAYTKATVVPLLQKTTNKNDCLIIQYDITAEKNIDAALRQSEKEKSIILSNTQTLICTHDMNGMITSINKAGAEMLESTPYEIIGTSLYSLIDPRYTLDGYMTSINETGSAAGYMKIRTAGLKKKTLFYKNVTCREHDQTYVIGSAIDMTETLDARKTIDNQRSFMTRMVDESANMICTIDEQSKIYFLNAKLKSFFKIADDDSIKTFEDAIIHIPDFETLTGVIDHPKDAAAKYTMHECRLTEPGTGIVKWFKVQKTIFSDSSQKMFTLIIATDISEKHAIQLELIKARQTVEASLKMREIFIANMSHEIRTPLNAIIGFSELLDDTILDDQQSDYLKTVKMAGQNLLGVINNILDLSKLESGKIQLSKNVLHIPTLVNSIKKLFSPSTHEKNLKFNVNVSSEIPEKIICDELRLTQILLNLAGNAVKFTKKGGVDITVRCVSNISETTANIEFSVKDTGIGIEKDKLDIIFHRYSQAGNDIHKLYGGTGLGLSISKSLIELLGGNIKVSSEVNTGSVFSFIIPVEIAGYEPRIAVSFEKENDSYPLRILLAEDNNTNAKLAIQVLKKGNHCVHHVKDGLEVLEVLKLNAYDLILMDVQMPQLDGIETAKAIRQSDESYNDIPIIALTAHSFKGERDICDQAGMDAYLSKPYRPQELISCIKSTLSKQNELSKCFDLTTAIHSE